jgi:tyrosyl-tRNA synthetase
MAAKIELLPAFESRGRPVKRSRPLDHSNRRARPLDEMSTFKSDFLNVLQTRSFIHQTSDAAGLDALAAKGEATAYVGYDCTAPSLHIGNFLTMMMLYWLQQTGNKPITLMGGGTTMVGDPSGKDETRALRSVAEIEANKASIRGVFAKVLRFGDGPTDAVMLDNAEWLTKLNWIEMLRDIGRHFSVNRMLTMDSVRLRLEREQEMSFIEFNYMVCQAIDFVELSKRVGCRLQMGGSDQWGNIVNGVDLGRRMGTPQLFAVTTPLLTTASGEKMGKTAKGAIWLNADECSPYDFWQYWRNVEDADVGKFLKLFTVLPLDEIRRLEALKDTEINEAKKVLATEATALLHGRVAADDAAETARRTFEEGDLDANLPTVTLSRSELQAGVGLLNALVRAGLVASNGEARRQIKAGGVRVNDEPVSDERMMLTREYLAEGVIKLSLGRKRHVLLRPA